MATKLRTVIIPAAGNGTQLVPATHVTAKELLPVCKHVAIDFAMAEAIVAAQRADPRRKATEAIAVKNARRAMSNGVEEKWAVQVSAVSD